MTAGGVPEFDAYGVIPAIRPGQPGASRERSPYRVSFLDFVEQFSTTRERSAILDGLKELRSDMRGLGLTSGFQWLNGSFLEDVETLQGRPPGDVDVVTFVGLGNAARQRQLVTDGPDVFHPGRAKQRYRVDHYLVNLDTPRSAATARQVTYWYSMWSHRRSDLRWKGFVEVPLTTDDQPMEGPKQ